MTAMKILAWNAGGARTSAVPGRGLRRASVWAAAIVLAALLAGLGSGCAEVKKYFKKEAELSAEEDFQRGTVSFEKGRYKKAIPHFQKILENYPFSIYALPAELKIAESYFLDKKYVEALVHLQGFQELHPTNENIPYVIWMKGASYFEQFSTIDRDVSSLENARRELLDLQTRFPDSEYALKGQETLRQLEEKLARHEFYVARFYYRDGEFDAALRRLTRILDRYPDHAIADRSLFYMGKAYFFLQDNEDAHAAFARLLSDYPKSAYKRKAKLFLKDIERGRFTLVSRYYRLKERFLPWYAYE